MASLDHDLGACEDCLSAYAAAQLRGDVHPWQGVMPNCPHFGTGYTLVCWMEETGHWPHLKPAVHSMNPEGARRMRLVIDHHFYERG
jgi:hypothetical protein